MAHVSHFSHTASAPAKSRDIAILLSAALVAVGLCIVVALHADPARVAPADPVAAVSYPSPPAF